MPNDPVCLMNVGDDSEFKKEYKGRMFYFCSEFCLKKFEKEPQNYLDRHKDFLDK